MIYSVAHLRKIEDWTANRETILDSIRDDIAVRAFAENHKPGGVELVEVIYLKGPPWLSALPENATHVKVTVEREAS